MSFHDMAPRYEAPASPGGFMQYKLHWTPDFTEDVYGAVAYVANELGSPIAARNRRKLRVG